MANTPNVFFADSTFADEIDQQITELFKYAPWDEDQKARGMQVRTSLEQAFRTIIENVPPCHYRTIALRKLLEARMDCNAAITFRGKY